MANQIQEIFKASEASGRLEQMSIIFTAAISKNELGQDNSQLSQGQKTPAKTKINPIAIISGMNGTIRILDNGATSEIYPKL